MFFPLRDDNPHRQTPYISWLIIALNVGVQVFQSLLSPDQVVLFIRATGTIPLEIFTLTDIVRFPDQPASLVPIPLTLLTSIFVHGGWIHLIGNMWYLWIFGDNVESEMGHGRFLVFYLLGGLAASGFQVAINATSIIPTVGASGAIAALLGAYLILFPHARIQCLLVLVFFIQIVRIPAVILLGFWFLMQVFSSLQGMSNGGVAWFAHIGGFVVGMILVKAFVRDDVPA